MFHGEFKGVRLTAMVATSWFAFACTVSERGVEVPKARMNDSVRLEGTVSHVDELPSPEEHLSQVAVITLHASGTPVRVELAPDWFLEQHGLKYTPEQLLLVRGERVDVNGESIIIAREVEQGEIRLRLRDEQGRPVWEDRAGESDDGKVETDVEREGE